MKRPKTKILLISASSKTGGGPSHIFLLKKILKDEFDFYLAMPKVSKLSKEFDTKKYLEIAERKILIQDIIRLVLFSKKNSINIIHAHGKGAGLIARIIKIFLNKPLIYTFHGIHTICLNKFKKYFYIIYENLTGWLDDEKVFVSLSEKIQAINMNLFINKNHSIINNSTENMIPLEVKENKNNFEIGIRNQKKNIISICRLVDQKNIFEIFEIARNLQIYNFIILGDGYLLDKAKFFINSNNIKNVYLFGKKNDVFKYLYESDLFLSTSLYEGHPISILEAMSIGLPIVASKVIGNIDTIKDNYSGLFYRLGDINQAVYCIQRIMNDNSLKSKISFNAFSSHRKLFTTNKMKKSYLDLYKKFN